MTTRTLLLLYPGEVRERIRRFTAARSWLRDRGFFTILADDWIDPRDAEVFDETLRLPPAHQVEAVVDTVLQAFVRRRLSSILIQSEAALAAGAVLCSRLSLPGPSPDAAHGCLNKLRTRQRLLEAAVPQPVFQRVSRVEEIRRFARAHGLPVILKPVASTMARGVTKVTRMEDLEKAIRDVQSTLDGSRDVERLKSFARSCGLDPGCDPEREFLVESFAEGDALECDGLVCAGKARLFEVIEQRITSADRFFIEGYLLPADRSEPAKRNFEAVAIRALDALCFDQGGFSIEMRAVRDLVQVIEVNGRLGEDNGLFSLIERICGIDPLKKAIELASGDSIQWNLLRGVFGALAYANHFADSTVAGVPASAECRALEQRGVEIDVCVRPGDRMHAPPHPETFPHLAYACALDSQSSRAAFQRAREAVIKLSFRFDPAPGRTSEEDCRT